MPASQSRQDGIKWCWARRGAALTMCTAASPAKSYTPEPANRTYDWLAAVTGLRRAESQPQGDQILQGVRRGGGGGGCEGSGGQQGV